MDLQHWAINLPEHADPATPGVGGRHFRYSSATHRPSPSVHRVGSSNYVFEATHGFTCVTACSFAVWKLATPRYRDAASSCYRGVRTIPRTGLQPARMIAVTANGQTTINRFFVISSGFQDRSGRASNEIDDRHEGLRIAVTTGAGTCRLEQSIEPFQSGIGVRGCPATNDLLGMVSERL